MAVSPVASQENDTRPLCAPGGSQQVTSGTELTQVGCKLVVCVAATGNLTIETLDGASPTLTALPVGVFTFDVQHQKATWTGTMTAVSFFRF
jgi:hypothetical protein